MYKNECENVQIVHSPLGDCLCNNLQNSIVHSRARMYKNCTFFLHSFYILSKFFSLYILGWECTKTDGFLNIAFRDRKVRMLKNPWGFNDFRAEMFKNRLVFDDCSKKATGFNDFRPEMVKSWRFFKQSRHVKSNNDCMIYLSKC